MSAFLQTTRDARKQIGVWLKSASKVTAWRKFRLKVFFVLGHDVPFSFISCIGWWCRANAQLISEPLELSEPCSVNTEVYTYIGILRQWRKLGTQWSKTWESIRKEIHLWWTAHKIGSHKNLITHLYNINTTKCCKLLIQRLRHDAHRLDCLCFPAPKKFLASFRT